MAAAAGMPPLHLARHEGGCTSGGDGIGDSGGGDVAGTNATRLAAGRSGGGTGAYSALVSAAREAVLQTLADAGVAETVDSLRASIVRELVMEPEGWAARYGLSHGAAFGLSHGLGQLAAFRPALRDARVGGLYFAGASARPGNGVPLVMIGADLCVQRVLEDLGKQGKAD